MPWKQFYEDSTIIPRRANAHLCNKRTIPDIHDIARLLSYPWYWYSRDSQVKIRFFPRTSIRIIANHESQYYPVFIEPTFPRSLISRDIVDTFIINWNQFRITQVNFSIFNNPIQIIGTIQATPEFYGEDSLGITFSPSIRNTLKGHDWYIISNQSISNRIEPFILIGADMLHQIVTVFSKDCIMLGADDEI